MFHEIRFPTDISLRAAVAIERRTIIASADSGAEERNTPWANSRRPFQAGYGVKSLNDIYDVVEFFEERRGRLYGFRYKDGLDYKSTKPESTVAFNNQAIGVGDDAQTVFPLLKTYGGAHAPWTRYIRKPVAGTVSVGINGIEQMSGWTVSTTTGEITFDTPPGDGLTITAGFEFDVPVRFDTDRLEINLQDFKTGVAPSIPILELPDSEVSP